MFNYNKLSNYLDEAQKDPHWTSGELMLFKDNCRNHVVDTLNDTENITITIDENTGDITIGGQNDDILDKFYFLPKPYPLSKKDQLYSQMKRAMEEAKFRGIYDQVFKEIREKKQ